jgi:hypothetical protein
MVRAAGCGLVGPGGVLGLRPLQLALCARPPYERTLTGRVSRVYPKGRGSRVYPNGWGSRRYKLHTLIPFLTQPPHECTLTGRGSRVYPKGRGSPVRPGWGRRCAWASPLVAYATHLQPCTLAACADLEKKIKNHTLYEFVLYNSYKNCMNWYKNHTVYEFILYNLYTICITVV